jgi:hypothetical protein
MKLTPKQKAKELVEMFHPFTYTAVHAHRTSGEYSDAINCAIRSVEDTLSVIDPIWVHISDYYKEVKIELENYHV